MDDDDDDGGAKPNEDDEDESVCRFCFEPARDDDALVSPCACKGGQRYIHEQCLIRWQRMVVVRGVDANGGAVMRGARCAFSRARARCYTCGVTDERRRRVSRDR